MHGETHSGIVTAAFVIIGNEILSGRTRESNLAVLASALVDAGIRLIEVRVIPDEKDRIVNTIRAMRDSHDHVFTSGGIGPTHDDITCDSVAEAFGSQVALHPDAFARMKAHADRVGIELNESRMRMARTPVGASLIVNPISAAPGFSIGNVHVMAGVPRIFEAMVTGLIPTLVSGVRLYSVEVESSLGEGTVAAGLAEIQQSHPDIEIGSYPWYRSSGHGTTLVLRGPDLSLLDCAATEVEKLVRRLGGNPLRKE